MKPVLVLSLLALGLLLPNLAFATPGTSQVTVNNSTFDVNYDATGLEVTGIDADVQSSTVTVFVTTSDVSSTLKMTLDRNFFDSKSDGEDDDFLVLADGIETAFQESKSASSRTLTITVPSDTNSIDIIALGTTSFVSPTEQPPAEIPQETQTPPETVPEESAPVETPQPETPTELTCGPGTVLKDGVCVLEAEQPSAPATEVPKSDMTCGPGTVLKDGACVLDETCGPGTILKDGVCVLDQTPAPQAPVQSRGLAFELIAPVVAAFIIAFVIMMILWGIGKAGRKKN